MLCGPGAVGNTLSRGGICAAVFILGLVQVPWSETGYLGVRPGAAVALA